MTDDPMDQPDDGEAMELVFPFLAVQSQGGPYDDNAFVAGVQIGRIDRMLEMAAAINVKRTETVTIYSTLVPQAELCGMARGFPVMTADTEDDPLFAGWAHVSFASDAQDIP
jgi:hypothetical protein